ncbi:Fic family protein [Deinococcus sp.]|uniref:Fic family protein n=1 Tax=Deinococcus sp. TaxID=47478 RepID=UPI003C7AD708
MTRSTAPAVRAGRYIRQASGYRAFIPATLPPVPEVQTTDLLRELLGAQEAVARLDGIATTLPNADLLVFMYIRAEAVLSSQIEGTQASLDDVLRAEADLRNADDPKDVQEVINYIAALDHGLKRRSELPLSLRLIREIHAELMQGVRGESKNPGEFRRSQNWIGPAGATLHTARFVPPPVPEMLSALDNLEHFIYEEDSGVPNLIKIGLLHAQFETIHPFLDGNGRTGRLLITLLLCHYGLLSQPLLYLSYYFKLHRTEYYDRLQAVRDRGDWEGWLRFYLEGVRVVALESTEKTRAVLRLRQHDREMLASLGTKSGRALRVVDHLYRFPYVSVRAVQRLGALSYNTASALVSDLVSVGLLVPLDDRQRDRVYYHRAYLGIFQIDPAPGLPATDELTGSDGRPDVATTPP